MLSKRNSQWVFNDAHVIFLSDCPLLFRRKAKGHSIRLSVIL